MRILLSLVLFFVIELVSAQDQRTIYGYVSSLQTGEKLIGVTLIDTLNRKGAVTNEYGFFSLTTKQEQIVLKVNSFGYESQLITVPLGDDERNIQLSYISEMDEVVITANSNSNIDNTKMGTLELSMEKVDKLPVLLGEKDVLKILQLMPGVKSGGEGSSGLYVRGGGPDQNLILLDGVPIYNASHLFGFFSVFNSDAISSVTLTKGGFPARYGGRVSSVLDMRMKEGNNQKFNVEGSIGVIASRLLVEGPINKGKTAFIVSARRTYIDALVRPFLKSDNVFGYYFYDLNAKVNHEINKKHHIYLSSYFGRDKASSKSTYSSTDGLSGQYESSDKAGINWGNAIFAGRWNYRINPKMFSNTTVTYSQYLFEVYYKSENKFIDNGIETYSSDAFRYYSGINDWTFKTDLTYLPNSNHTLKFGLSDIYHTFKPGVTTFSSTFINTTEGDTLAAKFHFAHELSTYIENDHQLSNRLKANYGLHFSSFFVGDKQYHQFQPRLAVNYVVSDQSSVKLGYSRSAQFLHLLSNTGIGLPTDLWVPATERIAPVTSDQVCIAFNQEVKKKYNVVVEGYYKTMNNIIQYKEGSSFFSEDTDWQNKVEVGRGWSYGGELLLEKKVGQLTGWIGYTLSWTERQFENINFGEKFPYRYDRRNDVSLVLTYELNKKWDFGLVFVFGTGNAVTLATQTYGVASNPFTTNYYSNMVSYAPSINNYRMPSYHRMDIGANRTKSKKWGETVTSFSIYNVYNRRNAYFLAIEENDQNVSSLIQYSLFPIIPSISWKFKIDFEKMKQSKINSENK